MGTRDLNAVHVATGFLSLLCGAKNQRTRELPRMLRRRVPVHGKWYGPALAYLFFQTVNERSEAVGHCTVVR